MKPTEESEIGSAPGIDGRMVDIQETGSPDFSQNNQGGRAAGYQNLQRQKTGVHTLVAMMVCVNLAKFQSHIIELY